jgi:hypothetical protein
VGRDGVVPYIAEWSIEKPLPTELVQHGRLGIGYADEMPTDRDRDGVLWTRMVSQPGQGKPLYWRLHPLRQRRAMRRLLCQVCAGPTEYTNQGHLWLLVDQPKKWLDWPEDVVNPFPPVCLRCARLSVRLCPPLRRGFVAVRAHSTPHGVIGVLFREGISAPVVSRNDDGAAIAYTDPAIRWTQAMQLTRTLHGSTIVDLDRLVT